MPIIAAQFLLNIVNSDLPKVERSLDRAFVGGVGGTTVGVVLKTAGAGLGIIGPSLFESKFSFKLANTSIGRILQSPAFFTVFAVASVVAVAVVALLAVLVGRLAWAVLVAVFLA